MVPRGAVSPFRKPLGETCQDMQEDLRRKVVGSIKHGIPVHVAMAKLDCGGGAGGIQVVIFHKGCCFFNGRI